LTPFPVGDRLASIDSASRNAPSPETASASAAHLAAQTRLVEEMRDQLFSLASSLARSEEGRKAAQDALKEEKDLTERKIAEAVDEDRRSRRMQEEKEKEDVAAVAAAAAMEEERKERETREQEEREKESAAVKAKEYANASPLTPPFSNNGSNSERSSNASGSLSRFSFSSASASRTPSMLDSSCSSNGDGEGGTEAYVCTSFAVALPS
jgi:hypothetical protein